jgi:flagellar biosynthesis protein FlhB
MAEQDKDQKTEDPTSKRLEEAREKGQLPISREIATLTLFIGTFIVLAYIVPVMSSDIGIALKVFFERPHEINIQDGGFQAVMISVLVKIGVSTLMAFAVLCAAAVLGHILQTGLFYSTELIKPQWDRISPLAGIQKLFSASAAFEFLKSLVKIFVLGWISYLLLKPWLLESKTMPGIEMSQTALLLHDHTVDLALYLILVVALMAFTDLIYQRYQYFKNLMMTKQEIKDEYKQVEGDPQIKGRLRQLRMEKARKRMMAAVPKADVVITNPTHYAIALQYDSAKMTAPICVAKGADRIAQKIREIAELNNIPLMSNPPLARALYASVDLDQEIPAEHYRAVAEIISYVYRLKRKST